MKRNKYRSLVWALCLTLSGSAGLALSVAPLWGQETLEQAWSTAITVSRKLQSNDNSINAAYYQRQAAAAARIPTITAESSYTTMSEPYKMKVDMSSTVGAINQMHILPVTLPTSFETPISNDDFSTAGVAVTVPIYTGGKISSLERAGDSLTRAAQSGKAANTADLKLEVTQAFFLVQRMEKLLRVAVQAKESLDGHLKDVQNLLSQGIVTRTALLSAQVAHGESEQKVLQVEYGLKTAKAAYNRLLWRPLDTNVELVELDLPDNSYDIDSLMDEATHNRPELSQLAAQSRALCEKSDSIRAERRPQVAAAGSFGYLENDYLTPNGNWQGTVGVVWTPFNSVSRAQERSTRQEALAVSKMRDEAANGIRLQVQKAYNDEQVARNKITIAKLSVEQAEENLRLVKEQFNQGLANYTQVLDAQTLWTQANTNLCNAVYDALLASYTLRHAVGIL